MDRDGRTALRNVLAMGGGADLAVEIIGRLSEEDRTRVMDRLSFYTDRRKRWWRLGDRRILVADLPDSTIIRLLEEPGCRRDHEYWIRYGRDRPAWDNSVGIYCLILDEASFRGIKSLRQQFWARPLSGKHAAAVMACHDEAIRVGDSYRCVDCQGNVTVEYVQGYRELENRIRLK